MKKNVTEKVRVLFAKLPSSSPPPRPDAEFRRTPVAAPFLAAARAPPGFARDPRPPTVVARRPPQTVGHRRDQEPPCSPRSRRGRARSRRPKLDQLAAPRHPPDRPRLLEDTRTSSDLALSLRSPCLVSPEPIFSAATWPRP